MTTNTNFTTALISLLILGCHTSPPSKVDITHFSAAERALIRTSPVIDIHTHTFNSRFLPIREIALGKRDKFGISSIFITDSLALALVHYIVWATEKDTPSHNAISSLQLAKLTNATLKANPTPTITTPITTPITSDQITAAPGIQGARLIIEKHRQFHDLNASQKQSLQRFANYFSADPGILPDQTDHSNEIGHFLACITAKSTSMESLYQNDHTTGKNHPLLPPGRHLITLATSHMMDMAPTYDQKESQTTDEDPSLLYPFREIQIPLMQDQQRDANGRLLYFVAYNPFRDTWSGDDMAKPGHALQIIKDAYDHHGAFGVKIYPPSGYAPAGNTIKSRPWAISKQPGRQWDARYRPKGRPPLTGADLDAELLQLCLWAVKNDVPLFTHCGQGEFEARGTYHTLADPRGWLKLLQDNSKSHPELRNLRLCLGHAGGGSEWFDHSDAAQWNNNWGATVYQLCRDYPHIYCEFGAFDEMATEPARTAFSLHISQLITASKTSGNPWNFSTKILYGSDWFMPLYQSTDRLNYLLSFQSAIYNAGGTELYKNYFYRNALAFLSPEKRIAKGGLPAPLVSQLHHLLSLH
jgi:Amidohydrolase